MVMTKSQAIHATAGGTNNQAMATSIEEIAMDLESSDEKIIGKDTNLGEDGKRRRSTVAIAESPNRRPPKLAKPVDASTEADDTNLYVTQAGETLEEENHDEEIEEDEEHWCAYSDTEGWSFTWTEMTDSWQDLPQEAKDRAQPFLLEDMEGTTQKSPKGKVQDLLKQMKLDDTNLGAQILTHLEGELCTYLEQSRGFNRAKRTIEFAIRLAITPPNDIEKNLLETGILGPL